jgi:hypothetical protein
MEPVWNQYVQQGILHAMTEVLSARRFVPLFEGFAWKHQDFNQLLAQIGSETANLATIDLSEASDRVSFQLINDGLLSFVPQLQRAVAACRSRRAKLPNGTVLHLRKFASMGSSLTFPMESIVFYTLIHLAYKACHGTYPDKPLGPDEGVRVYGDDLIVPVSLVPYLLKELETYGLKVNVNKSFWKSFFRESCGSDWFLGQPVKPVRLRSPLPTQVHHDDAIIRAIAFHNHLYEAGWFATADWVARELSSLRRIPYSPYGSAGNALWTYDEEKVEWRYNRFLHRPEYRVLKARNRKPVDPLDSWGALQKHFLNLGVDPREKGHLERDGRSRCVGLNTGWLAPG